MFQSALKRGRVCSPHEQLDKIFSTAHKTVQERKETICIKICL